MDDWEQLRQRFHRDFETWSIELPDDALKPGVVWQIVERGWRIWTRFEIGAEDGRTRLDYYARHRMTDDRHVRLYANGEVEDLPSMEEFYVTPADATEAEEEEARKAHLEHNRAVARILEEKGFGRTDPTTSGPIGSHPQPRPDKENPPYGPGKARLKA